MIANSVAVAPMASGRIASMKLNPPDDFFLACWPAAGAGAGASAGCGAAIGAAGVATLFCAWAMKLVMSCAL